MMFYAVVPIAELVTNRLLLRAVFKYFAINTIETVVYLDKCLITKYQLPRLVFKYCHIFCR